VLKCDIVTRVSGLTTALLAPKKDGQGREVTDKEENPIPLIQYHLRRRVAENTADYFIHKDLGRFLAGELDYYIKSEVLGLDAMFAAGTLRAPAHFQLVQAVRDLGHDIIDFLAQFENFQRALFEKRKFVTGCDWCLTLDWVEKAGLIEELAELLNSTEGGQQNHYCS
jgi:adenine-specific DNA-methyltransferase